MKYTEKQLQLKILNQQFTDKILYYSLADKQGSTFGINTTRLLIFSRTEDDLFYLDKSQKVPFETEKNYSKGKKDIAKVSLSLIERQPKTNKIIIKYPRVNDKKQKVMGQWIFTFKKQILAIQWLTMLNNHKQQRLKGINNPQLVGDTLLTHLMPNRQENQRQQQHVHQSFFMRDSNIRHTNRQPQNINNVNNSGIRGSNVNNSGIRGSNVNNNQSGSNINNSGLRGSNNVNPNRNLETSNVSTYNNNLLKPQNDPSYKYNQQNNNNLTQSFTRNIYNSNKNNNNNQSRIRQSRTKQSKIQPKNQKQLTNDWNYKFIQDHNLATIMSYQKQAQKTFYTCLEQDKTSDMVLRTYKKNKMTIYIADTQTHSAKLLKKQFRNYHYILECCKDVQILGVPLCCMIEVYGLLGLVKADFPQKVMEIREKTVTNSLLEQLQAYTKINNSILYKSECILLDLTEIYGSNGQLNRIYVDNLQDYLPQLSLSQKNHPSSTKQPQDSYTIRPQLLQYNIQKTIQGGNLQSHPSSISSASSTRLKKQLEQCLTTQIQDTASYLSTEQIYISSIFDLKQFLHYRGINMKMLAQLIQETKNKFIKRYLETCLVAKLVKDQINKTILEICSNLGKVPPPELVLEGEIRSYVEGKSANNNQYWKRIALIFRKKWGFSINTHQIIGPFFLSCLMTLIPAEYDLTKLDKTKKIFEDAEIISAGFVTKLLPKMKSYYRFLGHERDKVIQISKYAQKDYKTMDWIVNQFQLESKQVPDYYQLNNGKIYILAYLSDDVIPRILSKDTLPCSDEIYHRSILLAQPPSTPIIKINLNYLSQCLQQKNYNQFKSLIEPSLESVNYWLGQQHPYVCQYYDKVSDYQAQNGNIDKSIKILQQSLSISHSTQVQNNQKIGIRYYALGSRNLKSGRKKQSLNNLENSKKHLEQCLTSNKAIPQYPMMLIKLSSLYLNNGDIDSCLKYGKQSIKQAQKVKLKDSLVIRVYEILSRAYEINCDKDNLKKLGIECARRFNKTKEYYVFDQMIKIGLTGAVAKLSQEKSKDLLKLTAMLEKQQRIKTSKQSLDDLMVLADLYVVIEKFIIKTEIVDRICSDIQNQKAISSQGQQYMKLLALVGGCVGLDFLEGLHNQKQFE